MKTAAERAEAYRARQHEKLARVKRMEEALRAIVTETEGTKTSKGIAIRGIALRALGEKEGKA